MQLTKAATNPRFVASTRLWYSRLLTDRDPFSYRCFSTGPEQNENQLDAVPAEGSVPLDKPQSNLFDSLGIDLASALNDLDSSVTPPRVEGAKSESSRDEAGSEEASRARGYYSSLANGIVRELLGKRSVLLDLIASLLLRVQAESLRHTDRRFDEVMYTSQ